MIALRHFGVVVQNLDLMLDFYSGTLGFKIVRRMEESGPFLDAILGVSGARVTTVKLGTEANDVLLELLQFQSPRADATTPAGSLFRLGPTHLALTVEDIVGLHERLAAAGARFTTPPQTSPDGRARVTFCCDPEGNPLELVQVL
jgi:catechol 2,3-dioxygenase-like lactoylglutathione lyase family enzyme